MACRRSWSASRGEFGHDDRPVRGRFLCAENRQLAQPAVIDNYVTSGLQEDHLSMGTNAGLKLHRALENCTQILAIEYLLAAQAFEFLKEQRFGAGTDVAWRCCASGCRRMPRTGGWPRISSAVQRSSRNRGCWMPPSPGCCEVDCHGCPTALLNSLTASTTWRAPL